MATVSGLSLLFAFFPAYIVIMLHLSFAVLFDLPLSKSGS